MYFIFWLGQCIKPPSPALPLGGGGVAPDDDDDAVKDVVGIAQVVEQPEGGQLQEHLQGKHAGEHHVADLQDVGQLLGLWGVGAGGGTQSAEGSHGSPPDTHRFRDPAEAVRPGSDTLAAGPGGSVSWLERHPPPAQWS